ncbi:MAG: radical SAM protein [Kiritimatiellia bacterium]|nr:radical SAM protein [Kiritimatiellia bacterium]
MTKTVQVCETFISIQGETTWAGHPCFFIRLSGCNLRCHYCDTKYAYRGGRPYPIEKLAADFQASKIPLVEVTGGEPLLQPGVYDLLKLLVKRGTTLLETNGSCDISRVPEGVITILDIKCPGSGQADKNYWQNMRCLRPSDEVKFVLCGRKDYEWARKITKKYRLSEHGRAVNFSPAVGFLKPQTLASWIIRDCQPVRLNLQLHKQIWPKAGRGK